MDRSHRGFLQRRGGFAPLRVGGLLEPVQEHLLVQGGPHEALVRRVTRAITAPRGRSVTSGLG
ncbi:MAG: hypothetical protein ACK56I_35155, partial [bacterium]